MKALKKIRPERQFQPNQQYGKPHHTTQVFCHAAQNFSSKF